MTNERSPIITLDHVDFSYGTHRTLRGVDLCVREGDYLGVVGPNGAGKSTLLKLILGLLPPTSGSIELFGVDRSKQHDRSLIGYVPQRTGASDANFPATVYEVALMGRFAKRGVFNRLTKVDHDATRLALLQAGVWDLRRRLIGQLSGGQEQRVYIARALASEPKVLLLDEPTSGVDHSAQKDFYALLAELNHKKGLTIILVSHDIETITREVSCLAYVDRSLEYYETPELFLTRHVHGVLAHGHDH